MITLNCIIESYEHEETGDTNLMLSVDYKEVFEIVDPDYDELIRKTKEKLLEEFKLKPEEYILKIKHIGNV